MATRDHNADKFEEWIVDTIAESGHNENEEDITLNVACPCCETGKVQMQLSGKFKSVLANCSNFDEKKCGTHKVLMPFNQKPRRASIVNAS